MRFTHYVHNEHSLKPKAQGTSLVVSSSGREKGVGSLEGAVAVVTGAGRGLGYTIAEELGFGGAKVVVNYARIVIDRTLKKLTPEEWDTVVQVDLNSCFYTVKAALPHFMEQESGKIINISSFVGQAGNFGETNYAAAKAGMIGFTKAAAIEMARYNVNVNAIAPGFLETDMYNSVPPEVQEKILSRIPLRRVGQPREIARAVSYLVEDGDYITGETLSVNGGIYMD